MYGKRGKVTLETVGRRPNSFASPNHRDLVYDMFDVFTHELCDGADCLGRTSCDHQVA
jgi:hypothetical protein